MRIRSVLRQLNAIAIALHQESNDVELCQLYAAGRSVIDCIRQFNIAANSSNGYVGEKLVELDGHLQVLADIDDDNGHSADQHLRWAQQSIQKLQGEPALKRFIEQ